MQDPEHPARLHQASSRPSRLESQNGSREYSDSNYPTQASGRVSSAGSVRVRLGHNTITIWQGRFPSDRLGWHRAYRREIVERGQLNIRLRLLATDQRLRFVGVGGINTVVGYSLFALFDLFLFDKVPFGYLLSLVFSYVLGILLAFLLYRRFVFKVSGRVWSDLLKFVSVYLVAIGVNLLTLPLLIEMGGLNSLVAQAIVLVVTTLMSFFGHREFSFRREPKSEN